PGLVGEERFDIKDDMKGQEVSAQNSKDVIQEEKAEETKIEKIVKEEKVEEKVEESKFERIVKEEPVQEKKIEKIVKEEKISDKEMEAGSLDYVQSIERHLQTLDLEPEIVNDCTYTIKKAMRVIKEEDRSELGKVFQELKEMDYNLALISTYSVEENKKDAAPEFDTQKLKRGLPGFDTQKVPIGLVEIEGEKKKSGKDETGFNLKMYDDIEFKKEDTKPIKVPKKSHDTQPIKVKKS
ncbi:hypothetical protein ACFLRB_03165, partial [Acidobacteriota bacterium]